MDSLTELQKADIRLKAMEIAFVNGTKAGMEKDACLEAARKIYKFAIGETDNKVPNADDKKEGNLV